MPFRVTISLPAAKGLLQNSLKTTPVFSALASFYPQGSRHFATNHSNMKVRKPSKSLHFIRNEEYFIAEPDEPRPLAIILGWYNSKQSHLMKFADIYLKLGFDVLFTSLRGLQVLWPRSGSHVVASEILTFLGDNLNRYDSMLVHGFSAGGYLWGETMVKMTREPDVYPDLRDVVKGHIWDSFVDWDGVPRGTSRAIFPKNGIMQKALEFTLTSYGKIFYNHTTKYYIDSSNHFHYTPIKSPVLYLASEDDQIAVFDGIHASANRSLENGNQVFLKSWPSSPHVGHYLHHKDDYVEEVLKFLQVVGLIEDAHKAAQVF